jgi:hypothetical protein
MAAAVKWALVVLATALPIAGARSEPVVRWEAPPPCPDEDAFRALVEAHLQDEELPPSLRIEVEVRRAGELWRLMLRTRSDAGEGERSLEAADCGELAETAALVIALAVAPAARDALAAARRPGRVHDDETPPAARPRAPGAGPMVTAPTPRRRAGVRLRLGAVVGGDTGVMPGFGPTVAATVAAGRGRWWLEVGGLRAFGRSATLDDPSEGFDLTLVSGLARLCRELHAGLSACLAGEVGRQRSVGFGFGDDDGLSETHDTLWAGVGGGGALRRHLGNRLWLRVDVQAIGLVHRPVPVVLDQGVAEEVFRPPALFGRLFAGLEVEIR